MLDMTQLRIADVARLLAVSDDTVRRWVASGALSAGTDGANRKVIDGRELARFAGERAPGVPEPVGLTSSARNRFVGLVTKVTRDIVMAQVELQCGPYRVVSLMSSEAADELGLEPGVVATASIKSTNVVIEVPEEKS